MFDYAFFGIPLVEIKIVIMYAIPYSIYRILQKF